MPALGSRHRSNKKSGGGATVSNTTVFRRSSSGANTRSAATDYRSCLMQLGMDDPQCAAALQRAGTEDAQYALRNDALGQWDGHPNGLCGPLSEDKSTVQTAARLWSGTCRAFCRDQRSRYNAACRKGLSAHCARQTRGDGMDPMCACYMTPKTGHRGRHDVRRQPMHPSVRRPPIASVHNPPNRAHSVAG